MTTTASPAHVIECRRRSRGRSRARRCSAPAAGSGMRVASSCSTVPGGVGAAIVHHHDFVRHVVQAQFQVEVLHRRARWQPSSSAAGNHHAIAVERRVPGIAGGSSSHPALFEPLRVVVGMARRSLPESLRCVSQRPPAEIARAHRAAVHHQPGDVVGPRREVRPRGVGAEPRSRTRPSIAPATWRSRCRRRPCKYAGPPGALWRICAIQQGGQVARMKGVPHLIAGAAEADIAQRPAAQVGVDPVGEDPLLGRAELARRRPARRSG